MLGQYIQEILVRIHSQILLEFILEMHETNLLICKYVQSTIMYKGEVLGLRVPEPDTSNI